ncbi:hypothetical protein [Burkholderia sp. JP2-270]|uniref:hypothetical protein n=1 Tax=Burkholderia sp. JP2-270 TaxID=2217913 RepID=UPI0013A6A3A1|nr:hypothetical protein [Burkholderia sp. JP2-270]
MEIKGTPAHRAIPRASMTSPARSRSEALGTMTERRFLNPYCHSFIRVAIAVPCVRVA